MKWIFWSSLLLIAYTYVGYPVWLYVRARWRSRPVHSDTIFPSVSVVMALHNEKDVVVAKLRNLARVNYPADRYEIVAVSDGSTDGTNKLLETNAHSRLRVFVLPQHEGKASALNRGIQEARGEIVVFTDARQMIEPEAIRHLVANFADRSVGCVSGELKFGEPNAATPLGGVGLYWRIEKKIRQWEGASGSVVGATGACYAVRRNMIVSLPVGTIVDDVYIPLHVARQGGRVVFEPRARAWDTPTTDLKQEFWRKVRTLTGNYQLLQLAPWILTRENPLRFELISHKLLRLFVHFGLMGALFTSALLEGRLYRVALVLQLVGYGLGAVALLRPKVGAVSRVADAALTFLVLNLAAGLAFWNYLTGKKEVWMQPTTESEQPLFLGDGRGRS